jgi:filamentous hemagglutinin
LQEDVEAQAKITEAFGKQASQAIGDYAGAQLKKAVDSGDTEAIEKWKEGGAYRVALHTLAGGLSGGVAGAAGAGVTAATMPQIADAIKSMGLPEGLTKGLIAATGAAVGAAVGGAQGAASGFNQTANNYLKHEEDQRKLKAKADCTASGNPSQCRRDVEKEYNQLGRERQERKCTDAETCRANRDEIAGDLQTTLARQEALDRKSYQGKQKLTEIETQEYISNSEQISRMNGALEETQRQLRKVIPYDQWTAAEKEKAFADAMTAVGGLGAAGAVGRVPFAKQEGGVNSAVDGRFKIQIAIDIRKFSDYIFTAKSGGKDTVFRSLGYTAKDSEALVQIWQTQAAEKFSKGEYTLGKVDQYGQRINIEIVLPGKVEAIGKTSYLKSGWMIQPEGGIKLNTPFSGFTRNEK